MSTTRRDFIVIFVLSLLISLFTTIPGYDYGDNSSTIEIIPMITRTLDPTYLPNDYITNVNSLYTPRYYFEHLLAGVSLVIPLDATYFLFSLLSNFGIAFVTGYAVRDLSGKSLTAVVVTMLIIALARYWGPGGAATIHKTPMLSATLATPAALWALWMGIRQRYIFALFLCGVATLIHSLTGLGIGGILLVVFVLNKGYLEGIGKLVADRQFWLHLVGGGALLGIFGAFMFVPYLSINESIDSQQFIDIYGYFRNSHHIIPSAFAGVEYINLALFIVPLALAWRWWYTQHEQSIQPIERTTVVTILLVIFLLLVGGYVFVELIPARLWVTFQAFRFVYVIRWIGFILIGMNIGYLFDKEGWGSAKARLLLIGAVSPLTMLVTYLLVRDEMTHNRASGQRLRLHGMALVVIIITTLVLWTINQSLLAMDGSGATLSRNINGLSRQIVLNVLFVGLYIFNFGLNYRVVRRLAVVGAVVCVVMGAGLWMVRPAFAERYITALEQRITPIVRVEDLQGAEYDVAAYVRDNTPSDAIFVIPPRMGHFRYTAVRAVIAEFSVYSWLEADMAEWQQRLFDVYGETDEWGWDNATIMEENYHHITDTDLLRLQDDYGASFAVLFADTETDFPVLFEAGDYNLVEFTLESVPNSN